MPSTPTQPEGQDAPPTLYELLTRDGDALAALRAVYSGDGDVLDAVWWREHPLSVTPEGRPDPAGQLAELKTRAFSRAGSVALVERIDPETGGVRQVPEAAAALEAAENRLRADSAALDAALQDARPALDAAATKHARTRVPESKRTPPPGPSSDPTDPAVADPVVTDPVVAAVAAETWRRRSMIWMFTSIAAGILLLLGVALVVVQQVAPQSGAAGLLAEPGSGAGASASSGTTQTPTPHSTDVINNDLPPGLTIFEDPGLAPSIPPQNIDPYYKPESLRLLGVADSDLTVYAVENRIDQPCLLAVYQDGTQSATCVTKEEFASMGIELRITSLRVTRPGDPAPYRSIAQDVVFWNPDGSYGVSSSPTRTQPAG